MGFSKLGIGVTRAPPKRGRFQNRLKCFGSIVTYVTYPKDECHQLALENQSVYTGIVVVQSTLIRRPGRKFGYAEVIPGPAGSCLCPSKYQQISTPILCGSR